MSTHRGLHEAHRLDAVAGVRLPHLDRVIVAAGGQYQLLLLLVPHRFFKSPKFRSIKT